MKVKKSEIQLLIAVIGVLIAVCTYFLVYSKFNEKSDALEAEKCHFVIPGGNAGDIRSA